LAGGRFEGDFGVGSYVEIFMECSEDAAKLGGFEEAGGSSAEVERVDGTREIGVKARGCSRS